MSTPAASAATWRLCETPPKIVVTLQAVGGGQRLERAVIWVASSRVGASTRPVGRDGRRGIAASRATRGMENASVLPLPVFPRPSTSRPASVSGSVSTWIGKGSDSARGERLDQRFVDAEFSERLLVVMCGCLSGIGLYCVARIIAQDKHKLARLPVGNIDRREKICAGAR